MRFCLEETGETDNVNEGTLSLDEKYFLVSVGLLYTVQPLRVPIHVQGDGFSEYSPLFSPFAGIEPDPPIIFTRVGRPKRRVSE